MTLSDIGLNWVLAGALLLSGAMVAVTLMARGRNGGADRAEPSDSWERLEASRRKRERVYAAVSYTLLFCCAGVAAALSFQGLVGFGRENLNLSGGWEYLVPFGLDGAAMFCAVIAVREASQGDSSLGSRLLVWLFAGAAAWFNWVHAPRGAGHAGAPQFFAGMSLSAAVLFDRALKQTRRAALREQGLVPRPLPQIRAARWLRAPRETYAAWSLMLLEGVRTLDEAVEEVREEKRAKQTRRGRRREQRRLEKARMKALGRQHRALGRRRVEVSVAQAGSAAPQPSAEPAAPAAPAALEAAAQRPALHGSGGAASDLGAGVTAAAGAGAGAGVASSEADRTRSSAASALDSLEEKLARIERQFS
ncbi:DUF2637 domain-containing protein [Streptomyces sp. 6N223]|uniref:DUF2637 domain-containing protein n=1 Tax=Streptomyces sp. 6N223 TaxID=3457412 RepID=UPI003FD26CD8